nr:DNA polymerase V subunit UmuD [Klebsiella pneumoniae]
MISLSPPTICNSASRTAAARDIVIAEIEGEFTVKRLLLTPRPALQAMNPDFPSLYPDPETLQIFGVVTAFIHKTRRAD